MTCINRFSEIVIRRRLLVLCDIDDTVFCYGKEIEEYWKSKIDDPGYKKWINIIKRTNPKLTDDKIHEFIEELIRNDCDFHFVTHRNLLFRDITYKHLSYFNLNNHPIHFLTGSSKGDYINSNFDISKYEGIVFIDDSIHNILDVEVKVNNSKNYRFQKSS